MNDINNIHDVTSQLDDINFIKSRITFANTQNKYDVYVINLEHRIDRKNMIQNMMENQNLFNVHWFKSSKTTKGYIGCALAHLSLIKYANALKLPYIIVMEDDTRFLVNMDDVKKIIDDLDIHLNDWEIFNGNPSLYHADMSKLIKYKLNDNISCINWGQTANFIIYNSKIYDKMATYNFSNDIDLFISQNFIQAYPNTFITTQINSYSDIGNNTTDYQDLFEKCEKTLRELISENI